MAEYYEPGNVSVACASWAPVLGFMGCAFAVVFASESVGLNKECEHESILLI